MKRMLLCLVVGFAPLLAHAGCEDNLAKWTQQLRPGRTLDTQHAACKVWPANEALTIAALPLPQEDNDDEGKVDLEVLVADTASGTVIAHQFQKAAVQYDAVRFSDRLIVGNSNGEWDGNCAGRFNNTTRSLDLGPAGKNGYAALKVSEKSVETVNTPTKNDCARKEFPPKRANVTLDYRSGKYGVPKGMQYVD